MDDKPREELERRMDELAGSMQRLTSQYSKRKWKQSAAASLECWTTIVEYGDLDGDLGSDLSIDLLANLRICSPAWPGNRGWNSKGHSITSLSAVISARRSFATTGIACTT